MEASSRLERNKQVYRRFVAILNAQDFDALPEVVDPARYREICVGFTPGRVNLTDAITSLRRVLVGIPDLQVRVEDCAAEGDRVYARLTVTGTNSGPFYGAPATGSRYVVNMFDYVQLADGKIVDRIQQSDTVSQLRQMYTPAARRLGLVAAVGALVTLAALVARRIARQGA